MRTTPTIQCQKINNLRIRDFYSEQILTIPTAYTRDVIPISRLHIPTNMTASKWSHHSFRDAAVIALSDGFHP